jgi:hypothetical protein
VVDELNRPLRDVRREEFRVFEDGVAQQIAFFSREETPTVPARDQIAPRRIQLPRGQ